MRKIFNLSVVFCLALSLTAAAVRADDTQDNAAPSAHVKKPGAVFKVPGSHTHDVALSPDGKILARAGTGQADGWDVASGKQLGTLTGQPHFYKVAFSPDGKTLASISGDVARGKYEVEAKLWDLGDAGKERVLGKGDRIRAFSMAFSPDSKTLATSYLDPAAVKFVGRGDREGEDGTWLSGLAARWSAGPCKPPVCEGSRN